ncbi:hypothetical protein WJX84_001541 [Apatococcus fuscideae]|uniref:protein-tyrosine-phosphatase n=1 Tax=Apatococcus fuscideae TaxID=2026836 RepID=A0AAW1SUP1_9CHLO
MSSPATEIRPGLYLGGITARLRAKELGIDYILSVLKQADVSGPETQPKRLVISVDDVEDANLLQHFPQCIAFIKRGLCSGGKVLVHCAMGISRSCTVMTAYLMSTESLSAEAALQQIREKRPICCPNEGFMEQLAAFDAMNRKLLIQHPAYKKYRLQHLAEQWQETSTIDTAALANPSSSTGQMLYRCRKCRRLISTQNEVVSRSSDDVHQAPLPSSCLFVEPMQWMSEISNGQVQGKLYCPGCKTRIGSFNWAGMRSPTGAWVTPAFHIQLSRMDPEPSQEAQSTVQIRQPLFRAASQS